MTIIRSRFVALAALSGIGGLWALPAAAELPPRYTVWADFGAVAHDTSIPQVLGVVDSITRTSNGTYTVHGGSCSVTVTVVREFPHIEHFVGPSHIKRVDIGPKHCKH